MAELTEPQKDRIVLCLARFMRPAEVVVHMREEFEIEIDVRQVVNYDPTHPQFRAERDKWQPIFEASRKAYLEEVATVPIANQGYRLQLLQEGVEAAKKAKNWRMVAELSEQAAKEVGGVLTNSRELNINGGRERAREMSSEDRRTLLGSIIAEELAKQADRPAQPAITKH